jgi:hypothetical protein
MEITEFIYNTILLALKGNRDFFKLIDEFHDKLPPQHKRAKKSYDAISFFTILDTTDMKMNLTTTEIDMFHKKLENFKYNKIYFGRKKIQAYSKNIQRLLSSCGWEKFGIAMIQNLLEDEVFQKTKPYLFGERIGKKIGY